MAVAAALVSSLGDCPVPERTVAFGEIGLSGEVRPVAHTEARLKEAAKLGFARALLPPLRGAATPRIECVEIARLADIVSLLGAPAPRG